MKDRYNRRIDYLRISVTDKCNLKCIYCMPSEGLKFFQEKDVLTDDEILRFVRIARKHGLRKVRITGGEPLMRKDIISLVSAIKKTGVRDLSITTNGLMLSKIAGDLKKAGL
ncbi:MAG: radical SAM protein, partial [Nitrospirota bacterium]